MKMKALKPITHKGKVFLVGDIFEIIGLSDDSIARLLELKLAEMADNGIIPAAAAVKEIKPAVAAPVKIKKKGK